MTPHNSAKPDALRRTRQPTIATCRNRPALRRPSQPRPSGTSSIDWRRPSRCPVAAAHPPSPRYAQHADLHAWAADTGRRLNRHFLDLADRDAASYAAFAAALKLPKDTPEEQASRTSATQAAARGAADVPLECVEACLTLVGAAEALAGRSNANASSDLNVAVLLGEAAARGAAANVLVNLPATGDGEFEGEATARVQELLDEIEQLAAETRHVVLGGETRDPIPASDED